MSTHEGAEDYDYTSAVIRVLQEAGQPLSDQELWARVMQAEGVPASDLRLYQTGPFEPGPHPRNILLLRVVASLNTDMGGVFPDEPLQSTGDGYWLRQWGPLPQKEVQRRAEVFARMDDRARRDAATPQSSSSSKSAVSGSRQGGGCYIATAVYGSYEAAPVLVLRRFRDERLARSVFGRLVIRLYYRFSPAASVYFGGGTSLGRFAKLFLDAVVRRLEARQ